MVYQTKVIFCITPIVIRGAGMRRSLATVTNLIVEESVGQLLFSRLSILKCILSISNYIWLTVLMVRSHSINRDITELTSAVLINASIVPCWRDIYCIYCPLPHLHAQNDNAGLQGTSKIFIWGAGALLKVEWIGHLLLWKHVGLKGFWYAGSARGIIEQYSNDSAQWLLGKIHYSIP